MIDHCIGVLRGKRGCRLRLLRLVTTTGGGQRHVEVGAATSHFTLRPRQTPHVLADVPTSTSKTGRRSTPRRSARSSPPTVRCGPTSTSRCCPTLDGSSTSDWSTCWSTWPPCRASATTSKTPFAARLLRRRRQGLRLPTSLTHRRPHVDPSQLSWPVSIGEMDRQLASMECKRAAG